VIEKTTYDVWEEVESEINHKYTPKEWEKKLGHVWVLKSEHDELVRKLTKEILDLSFEITELKGRVQK